MARFYQRLQREQRLYDLHRGMVKCSSYIEVAELLARSLANEHRWQHVSVFKASESDRMFKLLAEVSADGDRSAPVQEQPLSQGVLGYVYATRKAVNIEDVSSDPSFVQVFRVGWLDVRSEMCVPIQWDGRVQWLVNVEDTRIAAFSDDECSDLSAFLDEAGETLSRLSRQYLLESALATSSDAVFVTDNQAEIVMVNPAAVLLLESPAPQDLYGPFENIFKDPEVGRRIFEVKGVAAHEIELRRRDGNGVPVLISGSALPDDFSRKVFVAKDLTLVRRMRQLETLRRLFQEVAIQTHTPLALIDTWLRELKCLATDSHSREYCARALRQLKKVEISYDRLALSVDSENLITQVDPQLVDVGVELQRVMTEFPESETARISIDDFGELPYVSFDPFHLEFIFASVVAYLMRFVQFGSTVRIGCDRSTGAITLTFRALIPADTEVIARDRSLARARFDFALGEPIIETLMTRNNGLYRRTTGEHTSIRLEFRLDGQQQC